MYLHTLEGDRLQGKGIKEPKAMENLLPRPSTRYTIYKF